MCEKLADRPLTAVRLLIQSAMPSSRVLMPSVTTIVLTPGPPITQPLTAPASRLSRTATTLAAHTFQWWLTTSTGTTIAARPRLEATDRSTNSPTHTVHSSAAVRNTSTCWELKMVWNVLVVRNLLGSSTPYKMISSTQ